MKNIFKVLVLSLVLWSCQKTNDVIQEPQERGFVGGVIEDPIVDQIGRAHV